MLREVHRMKDQWARQYEYDLSKICAHLREEAEKHPRTHGEDNACSDSAGQDPDAQPEDCEMTSIQQCAALTQVAPYIQWGFVRRI